MKKSRQKMIGAYFNGRCNGGRNLYGFSERKVTSRDLPNGERKIVRHPIEGVTIKVSSDGYFEFQDIPENIDFVKKLIIQSKKSGKRLVELEDSDLQEDLTGEALAERVKEVQIEEEVVETEYVHQKFKGESKNKLSDAQKSALAKAQAARRAKIEQKKEEE